MSKFIALLTLACTVPFAAQAQDAPKIVSVVKLPDAPDPARLAVARSVAARLLPPGIYKQVMSSTMDMMAGNMGETLKALPMRQIAAMAGASPEDAQQFAKIDMTAIMAIYDPHWEERQQRTMQAMFEAMGDFFVTMEPAIREATAQAYANRFSLTELNDLNRYFATPTGAKFAGNYMTIMADPAVAEAMKDMMPKLMQQMPEFMGAAKTATGDLPPVRKLEDLSPAERTALAKAFGVDENKLKNLKGDQ